MISRVKRRELNECSMMVSAAVYGNRAFDNVKGNGQRQEDI